MLRSLLVICTLGIHMAAHAHGNHGDMGVVSKAYLESSIGVLKNVGTYDALEMTSSLANGDKKSLALTYTKQGIALHHAFQWEDSVRSFLEALRLDPGMSRAYLGLIISYKNLLGPNDSTDFATELLEHATESALALKNNEVDRLWVDVMALYAQQTFGAPAQKLISSTGKNILNPGNGGMEQLLKELIVTYKDPEAFAFVGWDLQVVTILYDGVDAFPKHSGILHYLVHITENNGEYQQSADYAKRLVAIAGNAPHIVHMYGHVLPMLGQWDTANEYFLKAHCIHTAVLKINDGLCDKISVEAPIGPVTPKPSELWHYSHNLELFGFSLMRTRDLESAEKIFIARCQIAANACISLFQFYLGEGMYAETLAAVNQLSSSLPAPVLKQIKIQAYVGQNKISEAEALSADALTVGGTENFAASAALGFAKGNLDSSTSKSLGTLLAKATNKPNFDTWSHMLPVMRKLHRLAKQYGAPETQALYDAIQKIDPGHPLE